MYYLLIRLRFILILLGFSISHIALSQVTYTTPGTYTWVVPPCVTEITVHTYGGGGGGGYASRTYSVVPGQTYTIVVGAGGTPGSAGAGSYNSGITTQPTPGGTGGTSSFTGNGANLQATGGTGGTGGASYNNNNSNDVNNYGVGGVGGVGSNGTTNFTGGNGCGGGHGNFGIDRAGAGGGAAGPGGNGGNAVLATSTANAAGGNGGAGRYWNVPGNGGYNGNNGVAYGGGGSGSVTHRGNYNVSQNVGGAGANGAVIIEYQTGNLPNPPVVQPYVSCNGATVADLQATGTNIQWYSDATGGTPLSPTTALVNGATYYATQTIDGCESARVSATVTINSTNPPTASDQSFCDLAGMTIADLVVSGTNLQWYSDAMGINTIATSTVLMAKLIMFHKL